MNKDMNNVRAAFFQVIEDIMQANTPEEFEKAKIRTELLVSATGGGLVKTCEVENEFIKVTQSHGTNFIAKGILNSEFFKDSDKKLKHLENKNS